MGFMDGEEEKVHGGGHVLEVERVGVVLGFCGDKRIVADTDDGDGGFCDVESVKEMKMKGCLWCVFGGEAWTESLRWCEGLCKG